MNPCYATEQCDLQAGAEALEKGARKDLDISTQRQVIVAVIDENRGFVSEAIPRHEPNGREEKP